jgi:hypothetical protein
VIKTVLESLAHVENFFQLNFLFSGLEVPSTLIFGARIFVFLVFGAGLIWAGYRIVIKVLECIQTFFAHLGKLPASFFLLLVLVIPLSSESLGARWIGYILLVLCLLGLGLTAALILVLWKYGVDHAVRLLDALRTRREEAPVEASDPNLPPDNIVGPVHEPPVASRGTAAHSWPAPG